jgi:serine phosphatase RsbU (regulator of sigma subunit)
MDATFTYPTSSPPQKLEEQMLDELRRVARRRSYPPGTILVNQGALEHVFYVVEEGHAVAIRSTEDGEFVLNVMGPREFFGEMGLLDNAPRMATVKALTEATFLEVDEDVFDQLVEHNPTLAYAMTRRILWSMRVLDALTIEELRLKNIQLQEALANLQAAQVELVEKERLERELELAADVQRSLLPQTLPAFPGYRFTAYLQPARSVGGDLYDVIQLGEDYLGILIADVADKGLHAALFMAVTRALFYTEALRSLSPAAVALAVHRGMMGISGTSTTDVFVTAFYGVLCRSTGTLTYIRAAHERPLLARRGFPVQTLPGDGRFLGMLPELALREYTMLLQPGDRLLFYSDGVPDAQNPEQENYGRERLLAALDDCRDLDAPGLVRYMVEDISQWTRGAAPTDDITLLALAVEESGE